MLLLFLLLSPAFAFYIPGWSIRSYVEGESVPLYGNKVTSDSTQLPFAYFELPFVCQPVEQPKNVGLNLGEILGGDRIVESGYQLNQNKPVGCNILCNANVDSSALESAHSLIKDEYVVEWIVDNLPGATAFVSPEDPAQRFYASGFPLGTIDDKGRTLLNNHVTLLLRYRKDGRDPTRFVIVGFEVYPRSIANNAPQCADKNAVYEPFVIDPTSGGGTIRYSYSVYWKEDNSVQWGNRWDKYFLYAERSNHVHWMAIVNSLVIAILLSFLVAVILIRTLRRDIATYRKQQKGTIEEGGVDDEPVDDDELISGWKLVYADVFRPPALGSTLTALVASGMQLLVMAATVVAFACIGILNPSYRGGMLSYAIFLFAFAGIFGGYVNVRLNRTAVQTDKWAAGLLSTAVLGPAVVFFIILLLNLFAWAQASSSALPIQTIIALFAIWLLISCPLVFIGGIIARKTAGDTPRDKNHLPSRVSTIPRQIPPLKWYRSTFLTTAVGGLLPFLVIFVEMAFVFKSVWEEKTGFYYVYGFLAISMSVLILTVAEVSVVATYFQLNAEDYHWWWKSFLVGTGSAWWVLAYSLYYLGATLEVKGFTSGLLYVGYSVIGCIIYGLITGAIGFIASYLLVFRMYNAIKVD